MLDSLTNVTYKAAGYLRLSVEDTEKDNEDAASVSINNQKSLIKEYAKKNNIEIVDFYIDDGYSGSNFDRPGFKRMINDIENGLINCVITKDTSRLGREYIDTSTYIFRYFPSKNVRYISILDNYDTFNPNESEDYIPFKAVINDMYIKDISRKVKSIRHDKMKEGLFVSGNVPYGYKRSDEDNRILVIDSYSAGIVKRIFDMRIDGTTPNMIARTLSGEGILPPQKYSGRKSSYKDSVTSNLWSASTVKHILQNEIYIGTLIQGKYGKISLKLKKKKLLPKSKWVIKKNAVPAIISKEIFDKVQINNNHGNTRYRKYDYLCKGLVVCADCGKTMMVRKIKNKNDSNKDYGIYICRTYAKYRNNVCSMHYFREENLNDIVLSELKKELMKFVDNKRLEKVYEETLNNSDILTNLDNDLKECQNKIITIDKAISELYKDKAEQVITDDDFKLIKKDLLDEKNIYDEKIKDINIMIGNTKNLYEDDSRKKKIINDFLKVKNPTKEMLKTFINKIELSEDKSIKIYYNFNISGRQDGK